MDQTFPGPEPAIFDTSFRHALSSHNKANQLLSSEKKLIIWILYVIATSG